MAVSRTRMRRLVPGLTAIAVAVAMFFGANLAVAAPGGAKQIAAQYKFKQMPIAMPPGYHPTQSIRQVNPAYWHIRSWISSVGAGIALNDVTGHGLDDGMCIVDPRTNDVIVTYTPTAPQADRFTPFVLNP